MAQGAQTQFLIQGDVYEVEKLVGFKIEEGKKLYKIRWKGYSAQSDTYEPEENLLSCKDMIVDLEEGLEKKKAGKKLSKTIAKQNDETNGLTEESQQTNDSGESCKDQSKDTFWIDFNAGKINVFGQDMYSKVKERAARAVTQTESKPNETVVKDIPPLQLCPKVVLKRRTNPKNAVPTYRSSLHLKPVSIGVKKRKKYDVLRDYRKRKYRPRKRKTDENKQMNGNSSRVIYQSVIKPRTVISLTKSPIKCDSIENTSSSEYLKVLKELRANDEVGGSDSLDYTTIPLPTSTPPKILLESEKGLKSTKSEDDEDHISLEEKTDPFESVNKNATQSDHKVLREDDDCFSTANLNFLNTLNSKHVHLCGAKKNGVSKLNVVSSHQTEMWSSMNLKEPIENILTTEKTSAVNQLVFDLLIAATIQGRLDIMEKLCSQRTFLNQTLDHGITIMMILAQMGLHDGVRILLKYNAHKDIQNQYGETALMLACRHKHPKVVKLLLEHGANFALTNAEGINASRISNKYANEIGVANIMNEHISRMKLEFETQTRNIIDGVAEIKYALFPLQCFSLCEGPLFNINFSHHVELESPGKGGKEFLLFIANCKIKGNRFKCEFIGISPVLSVCLKGKKQETFKGNNFLYKISCLCTGNNEVRISTVTEPESDVQLIVCAYRVHYCRGFFSKYANH